MGRSLSYRGVRIADTDDGERPEPGDYYLIKRVDNRSGSERYLLSTEPGRTNMSGEEKTAGWLGTTNDVARFAEGCVRVTRDADGRTRIAPVAVESARITEEA